MTTGQNLMQLPARDDKSGLVNVIIDTPRGSRNKLSYEEDLALFRLSKVLPLGASFPYDFGFIPSTRGEDGDALDILVLLDEPAFTGCLVGVRLLGVLQAEQTDKGKTARNDRLIGVLETRFNPPEYQQLSQLPEQRLAEIEHFFISYNVAEGRTFKVLGRAGPKVAETLLQEGMERFQKSGAR